MPGEPSEYSVRRSSGKVIHPKSKDILVLDLGDTLMVRTAGGGGYGDHRKRKPSLVKEDLENQFVTEEQAKAICGYAAV